jgi:hypothetical protein
MKRIFLSAAVAAAFATACSNASKGLSVSAKGAQTATTAQGTTPTSLDLGNGIAVDRIRLVVRSLEVEGGDAAQDGSSSTCASATSAGDPGAGDAQDGDDVCENDYAFGPFLVDVAGSDLAAGVHHQFDVTLPAGTYEEIEIQVNTVPAEKAGSDAGLKEMADLHASIAVDGTIDGTAFRVTTPIALTQEREGPIVIDPAKASNVTLDLDPTKWFTSAAGARLDPSDPTALGEILANIRASLRLVHDDDRDGKDDASEVASAGGSGGNP